jgi:CMP-N-acetylneuraminic acid synthetase
MKQLSDILFIVQARLNSSRLPGKMLKPFAGSNITQITIDKVKQSIIPNKNFYLSINEPELIELANTNNVNVYTRGDLSIDNSKILSLSETWDWWDKLPFKYFVLINACNPLMKIETLNNFIEQFQQTENGLISVIEHKRWFYTPDGKFPQKNYGDENAWNTFNSQWVEPLYSNGPLKGGLMEDIGNNIHIHDFKTPPKVFKYPKEEYYDIDYQEEFDFAEKLYTLK